MYLNLISVAEAAPSYREMIAGAVVAIVTAFLVPWLKKRRNAEEAKLKAQARNENLSAREKITAQARLFFMDRMADFAERRFPKLAQTIIIAGWNAETIKNELRAWGRDVKAEALTHFMDQGVDVVKALGDKALDDLIETVANKVSPFPGRDTAAEMIKSGVSNMVIEKGVNWIRDRYLSGGDATPAPEPEPVTPPAVEPEVVAPTTAPAAPELAPRPDAAEAGLGDLIDKGDTP